MDDLPAAVEAATIKCIPCNAPVIVTVEDEYVCVDCGESPVSVREPDRSRRESAERGEPAMLHDA